MDKRFLEIEQKILGCEELPFRISNLFYLITKTEDGYVAQLPDLNLFYYDTKAYLIIKLGLIPKIILANSLAGFQRELKIELGNIRTYIEDGYIRLNEDDLV